MWRIDSFAWTTVTILALAPLASGPRVQTSWWYSPTDSTGQAPCEVETDWYGLFAPRP